MSTIPVFCIVYVQNVWHPSTLHSKESYTNHKSFVFEIEDFAKQAEKIHGASNSEMKVMLCAQVIALLEAFVGINVKQCGFLLQQVSLKPDEFASVNFACYAEGKYSIFLALYST